MKLARKVLIVLLVLISLISLVIVFYSLFWRRALSSEDLKSYAETFIRSYERDIDFYFLRHRTLFPFYSNLSYSARAVISEAHGVALTFAPSDFWSYQCNVTDERVEKAIFGGDWSMFPMILVPSGTVHSVISGVNGFFETSGHPFIDVQGNGSIILKNVNVNSVYYHCVVLKGSNDSVFWTAETAEMDAKDVFDTDLSKALSKSEEIRKRYAEPELTDLLQRLVINKLANATLEYSYLEMEEDIRFIEKLAQYKYNITEPSPFVESILNFLKEKAPTPKKTIFGIQIEDPSNWGYVAVCCIYPLLTFSLYRFSLYLAVKYRSKLQDLKGWGKFILGIIVTGGFSSLLYDRPYDYELVSVQTLIIFAVVSLGTFSIVFLPKRVKKFVTRWSATIFVNG